MAAVFIMVIATLTISLMSVLGLFIIRSRWHFDTADKKSRRFSVAFFHPYSMAGGGGERVLWAALRSLFHKYGNVDYVIYTGDDLEKCRSFRNHVAERFKIKIPEETHVEFVHLKLRTLLEAHHYPFLTMIGQSIGSIIVGLEALWKFCPNIYVDTTGYAFTFPVFRLIGGSQIAAYIHYPTISTDMLSKVRDRKSSYNNSTLVSRSAVLSNLKIIYYNIFAYLYGLTGRCCEITMVNSTWTSGHITQIWKNDFSVIVYPPCNVNEFLNLPLIPDEPKPTISIVSIGQFRAEKDHALQIRTLAVLLKLLPSDISQRIRLDFVGSCRNLEDEQRVDALRSLAKSLGVDGSTNFHLNAPFPELLKVCQNGTIGIHTMWNEHFGIGVVEGMAAGLITVAHNSGGPKLDIVVNWDDGKTGYLAENEAEYAEAIKQIILLNQHERDAIRRRARLSVTRFTDEKFDEKFARCMEPLMSLSKRLVK